MNDETLWDVMQSANVVHVAVTFQFDQLRFPASEAREREVAKISMSQGLANQIVGRVLDDESSKNYRFLGNGKHELYTMFCSRERLHDLLIRSYNTGYAAGLQRMPSATYREVLA